MPSSGAGCILGSNQGAGRLEGKYFRRGGYQAAQSELARDIYQCFFYRGLPRVPKFGKYPAWDYDYACLLAYDVSEAGNLASAWETLKDANRLLVENLWDGASIYAMVVRT